MLPEDLVWTAAGSADGQGTLIQDIALGQAATVPETFKLSLH